MAENKLLFDTNEEEQVSLVHNSSTSEDEQQTSNLVDTSRAVDKEPVAIVTAEEDWEQVDVKPEEKEHPLASLSLENYEQNDPWAAQSNVLLETVEEKQDEDDVEDLIVQQTSVATTNVIDVDNQQTQSNDKEILDDDTSAIKVNEN